MLVVQLIIIEFVYINDLIGIRPMKQQIESQDEHISQDYVNIIKDHEPVASQHVQQYNRILKINPNHKQIDTTQIWKVLEQHGIIQNSSSQKHFTFDITDFTPNYQVVSLRILYYGFSLEVNLINFVGISNTHQIEQRFHGSFASVYKAQLFNMQIAVKCQKYQKHNFISVLARIIQQYCIMLLASALQAGVFSNKIFGFDILIYDSCVQYSMEFCSHLYDKSPTLENDLIQGLQRLHAIHVIHFDIKPENICFSPTFKKYIFVDFGLSKVIAQPLGYKTQTAFRGSLTYCSNQMQQCYLKGIIEPIDLYYNDAVGLSETMNQIKKRNQLFSYSTGYFLFALDQYHFLTLCKFYIYKRMKWALNDLFHDYGDIITRKKQAELNQFLYMFNLDQFLRYFHILYISKIKGYEQKVIIRSKYEGNYIQNNMDNQQFMDRFHELKRMNVCSNESKQIFISNKYLLFDQQTIAAVSKDIYYPVLAHYLQINTNYLDFQAKVNAAKIFIKFCHLQFVGEQQVQVIALALRVLFTYASSPPHDQSKLLILRKILLSVIIFQLIDQEQLFDVLSSVLYDKLSSLNDKIKVSLSFLISIKWLYQKYQTNYQCFSLEEQILNLIRQAIINTAKYQNNAICIFFRTVLQKQLQFRSIISYRQTIQRLIKLKDRNILRDLILFQQLRKYLLYSEYFHYLAKKQTDKILFFQELQLFHQVINRRDGSKFQQFQYIFFILYSLQRKKQSFTSLQISHKFNQLFNSYNLHFKLTINSYIHQSSASGLQKLKHVLSLVNMKNISLQKKSWIISKIIQIIRMTSPNQRKYVLTAIKKKKILQLFQSQSNVLNIKLKLHYHSQKRYYSKVIYLLTYFLNYNQIKNDQIQNIQAIMFQNIKTLQCIECKLFLNIQMMSFQNFILYLSHHQLESFDSYVEIISLCLKYGIFAETINYLHKIIIYCSNKTKLADLFNPINFMYQCIARFDYFCYYIIQHTSQLLRETYIHFYQTNQYERLSDLIRQIIHIIYRDKEQKQILFLYNSLKQAVAFTFYEIYDKTPSDFGIFVENHIDLLNLVSTNNPYKVIYFIVLLPFTRGHYRCKGVFFRIANCFNMLDIKTKEPIVNQFIQQYQKQYPTTTRKNIYLKKKYKRYQFQNKQKKINGNIFNKIKKTSKNYDKTVFQKMLVQKIEIFIANINNK